MINTVERLRSPFNACSHRAQCIDEIERLQKVVKHQAATINCMLDETVEWECEIESLRAVLKKAATAISEELAAVGPDEVKRHPVLRRHASVLKSIHAALAASEQG